MKSKNALVCSARWIPGGLLPLSETYNSDSEFRWSTIWERSLCGMSEGLIINSCGRQHREKHISRGPTLYRTDSMHNWNQTFHFSALNLVQCAGVTF